MFKCQGWNKYRAWYLTLCEKEECGEAAVAVAAAARSRAHNCVVLIYSRLRSFSSESGFSLSSRVATVCNSNRIYFSDMKKKSDGKYETLQGSSYNLVMEF